MFDIAALRGAAERGAKKPKPEMPEISVEIETKGKPMPQGKPPMGGMDLAAELADCAQQYGMKPQEVIAEFKAFLASKKGEGAPPAEAEMEEAPEDEAMPA